MQYFVCQISQFPLHNLLSCLSNVAPGKFSVHPFGSFIHIIYIHYKMLWPGIHQHHGWQFTVEFDCPPDGFFRWVCPSHLCVTPSSGETGAQGAITLVVLYKGRPRSNNMDSTTVGSLYLQQSSSTFWAIVVLHLLARHQPSTCFPLSRFWDPAGQCSRKRGRLSLILIYRKFNSQVQWEEKAETKREAWGSWWAALHLF